MPAGADCDAKSLLNFGLEPAHPNPPSPSWYCYSGPGPHPAPFYSSPDRSTQACPGMSWFSQGSRAPRDSHQQVELSANLRAASLAQPRVPTVAKPAGGLEPHLRFLAPCSPTVHHPPLLARAHLQLCRFLTFFGVLENKLSLGRVGRDSSLIQSGARGSPHPTPSLPLPLDPPQRQAGDGPPTGTGSLVL